MNKNLQRLVALAVLVIFALSIVPTALAERGESSNGEETNVESRTEVRERTEIRILDRENGMEVREEAQVENEERVEDEAGEETSVRAEVRERIKVRLQDQKGEERNEAFLEKVKEAKERYEEAREALREKKEQLSKLKERARCKDEGEECKSKKQDLKRGVKEHLIKTVELIDHSLAKLQERVDSSKVLTEEEKEEALQKIADLEIQLEEKKAELEALADSMTNEELRTQIRELKDLWHRVRKEQRWIVTQLINAKQDNLVGIYVRYGTRVETQIAKLAEQGAEVASLEELLAKYRESVEELKVAQADAKAAWLEAKSSPEALEQAKKLQDAFKVKAKETKAVLRELLKKIKEVQQQTGETGEQETEDAAEEASEQPTTASETTVTTETAAESTTSATAE